jgi:phosphatidylglycerophosphate synthase
MKVKPSDIKEKRRLCSEFYSRNFSQKVSHYFSALFIRLNFSPNFITLIMLVLIIPISILILSTSYYLFIFGCFLLMLINVMDTSDGEVARFTNKTSSSGIYLDYVFQYIVDLILFIVLAIKFINISNTVSVLILIYLIFYLIDSYSKRSFLSAKNEKQNNTINSKNILKTFFAITSSNTFIYHSLWIILILDSFQETKVILELYFFYISIAQMLKTIVRFYLNYNILNNENL